MSAYTLIEAKKSASSQMRLIAYLTCTYLTLTAIMSRALPYDPTPLVQTEKARR